MNAPLGRLGLKHKVPFKPQDSGLTISSTPSVHGPHHLLSSQNTAGHSLAKAGSRAPAIEKVTA